MILESLLIPIAIWRTRFDSHDRFLQETPHKISICLTQRPFQNRQAALLLCCTKVSLKLAVKKRLLLSQPISFSFNRTRSYSDYSIAERRVLSYHPRWPWGLHSCCIGEGKNEASIGRIKSRAPELNWKPLFFDVAEPE